VPVLTSDEEGVFRAVISNSIEDIIDLIVIVPVNSLFLEILFLDLKQLAQVKPLFHLAAKIE
jgi:hypothetical protein